MKQLLYFNILLLMLIACAKDETMVVLKSDATPPAVMTPAAGFTKVITSATLGDLQEFTWQPTNYGVPTEVSYSLQIDSKCGSFTNPVVVGTTTATKLSISLGDLNTKLIDNLKLASGTDAEVQVRVTSVVNGKYLTESAPVTIKLTPYSDRAKALWLGENAPGAPVLLATSSNIYEGYRNIAAGTSFKIVNTSVCADQVYGAAGAGKITPSSTAPVITMPHGGYYKIKVNTETLTYDTLLIKSWGMIGSATAGGWDNSTPLVYNPDNDKWEGTTTLANGALKFRANNNWDVNFGPKSSNELEGTLIQTDDAISIADPGEYIVSIDLSQSNSPYAFTYSVKKSGDVAKPAALWLPGEYQGWDPGHAPTIYAISSTVFEGYVYISKGTGFKFTSSPDWDHINYGDAGTPGKLTTDGLANGLSINTAGYYKFKVDTKNLTYEIVLVNTWGMIGTATPGLWDSSTAMTYDATADKWTATINLTQGALKFRANNDWGLNYGPAAINNLTGTLITTNDAINIADAGSYTVTLDFSRKSAPYQYSYSVKKN